MSNIDASRWNEALQLGMENGFIANLITWSEGLFSPRFLSFHSNYYSWSASESSYDDTNIMTIGSFNLEETSPGFWQVTNDSIYSSVLITSEIRGRIKASDLGISYGDARVPSILESKLLISNDIITGSFYGDQIYAKSGDDTIHGLGGYDIIDGGTGTDVAIFSGYKSDYDVTRYETGYKIEKNSSGQYDRIYNIEWLKFDDITIAPENSLSLTQVSSDQSTTASSNTITHEQGGVYRLYNSSSGKHLFSSNQTEIDQITGQGWVNEGMSYKTPSNASASLHRFFVLGENRHFYTANDSEKDLILANPSMQNFSYEGIAFNVYSAAEAPSGSLSVVRYFNNNTGSHLYSTNSTEQGILNSSADWTNEGIAWYGDTA